MSAEAQRLGGAKHSDAPTRKGKAPIGYESQRRGVEPHGMAQKTLAMEGNGKALICRVYRRYGSAGHGCERQLTAKEWFSAETICGAMEQQFRVLIGNGNELLCGVAQWKSSETV